MKKFLAIALVLCMVFVFAACNSGTNQPANDTKETDKTSTPTDTAAPEAPKKSYQFTGVYEEEGSNAAMLNAAFLLNLNEDGTAVADRYKFSQYDDSDAATNPSFEASYLSGTWKEVEKDGVPCLQIKLAYINEDGTESNSQTAYAYDIAGEYSFDLSFPVVPGMSYTRVASMTGSETKAYADANAFIQAFKREFEAPEHVAEFTNGSNVSAYAQEDGTLLVYTNYALTTEGKWTRDGEGLKVTLGDPVEVREDGTSAAFTYSYDRGDGTMVDEELVCEDISVLGEPTVTEETPYTTSVDLGGNPYTASLVLGQDGKAKFTVAVDFDVDYFVTGSAVILSTDQELEGYQAQIWPGVPHTFILNDDRTMTAVANVWYSDSLTFIALDETNMKVEFPAYSMSAEGFTYSVNEEGTLLTVTAPEDLSEGFSQVWAGAGSENWEVHEAGYLTPIEE